MSKEALEATVLRLSARLARESRLSSARQSRADQYHKSLVKSDKRADKAESEVERLTAKMTIQMRDKLFRGPANRYLSLRGGFSLALRRTISNVGSAKLGLILQEDIGRRAITSAEIRLRAALLASTKEFNHSNRVRLSLERDVDPEDCDIPQSIPAALRELPSWRFSMYVLRGDATNSQVWQKQKLRTQEVRSYFACEPIFRWSDFRSAMGSIEYSCMVSDILVVGKSSGGGVGTLGMVVKQAECVGV
eukprot:5563240-Pyramimonas_sp.AAC.1